MRNKFITLFTVLSLVFGVFGTFTVSADETDDIIIEISTAAKLAEFRDNVNNGNTYEGRTIVLTRNIDLSDICGADINGEEISWKPIGKESSEKYCPFEGIFDGNGYTISSLYINYDEGKDDPSCRFFGLFGYTGENAVIKNLTVDGSVFVRGGGKLLSADPMYSARGYSAGIVGFNSGARIENCHNKADITSVGEWNYTGGIAGISVDGSIERCSNTGNISGTQDSWVYSGGICGTNNFTIIKNCFNTGSVSGEFASGISALVLTDMTDCYNTGIITSYTDDNLIDYDEWIKNYYCLDTANDDRYLNTIPLSAEQFADEKSFADWDFDNVWKMDAELGRPVLRPEYEVPHEINNADDFIAFRDAVNRGHSYEGETVVLTNDIELDINKPWIPIGGGEGYKYEITSDFTGLRRLEFKGIFDGQNHTISGINASVCNNNTLLWSYQGLFGYVNGAKLKNFTVKGKLSGTVNNTDYGENVFIGGIAAYTQYSELSNISSFMDINITLDESSPVTLGGITGITAASEYSYSSVADCVNYGNITVTSTKRSDTVGIGGIAGGVIYSTIDRCMNCGNISTDAVGETGGVAAYITRSPSYIYSSANTGRISVNANAGYAGGVIGWIQDARPRVINCYGFGKMTCPYVASCGGISGSTYSDKTLQGNYYLDTSADSSADRAEQGNSIEKTAEQFASGEVAYLLNEGSGSNGIIWYQNIGEDKFPVLDNTHPAVLFDGEKYYNDNKSHEINAYMDYTFFSENNIQSEKITSLNQLEDLVYKRIAEKYDEEFFTDKFLYLHHIDDGSSRNVYTVSSAVNTENSINIEVIQEEEGQTDDIVRWYLIAEIDKDCYDKDINITFTKPSEEQHKHKICSDKNCADNHDDIIWTAWDNTDSLPAESGNYYLTQDVTLNMTWDIPDGTELCLNGHSVIQSDKKFGVMRISSDDTFSLCDCAGGGEITGGEYGVYVFIRGMFNMYSGKITGNRYDNGILEGGGVVCLKSVFNMYGGEISGNTGEGVHLLDSEMNMGGSVIIKDNVDTNGRMSNVYLMYKEGITILSPLTDGAHIGISYHPSWTNPVPINITGENNADYSRYFHADNDRYMIVNGENNVIQLAYSRNSCPYYKITDMSVIDTDYNKMNAIPENTEFTVYYTLQQIAALEIDNYGYAIAAVYDRDGALIAVQSEKITRSAAAPLGFNFSFDGQEKEIGTVKAFVWDGFGSIEPLAETETLSFTEN